MTPTPASLPRNALQLTDEQQRIVAHEAGPAVVFATPGSGKTTTSAARIAQLIRNGAEPKRILASSYGRDATEAFRMKLKDFPGTQRVQVNTVHALGMGIINLAVRMGLSTLKVAESAGDDRRSLYLRAVARVKDDPDTRYLAKDLSEDDFNTFLEIQKGNLKYADLSAVRLPGAALELAGPCLDGSPAYLELYRQFEVLRREAQLLTYPDMIVSAWELLLTFPTLLAAVQGTYDHVTVDEYQDVNLAQRELIDLVCAKARSVLILGDDDQNIYTWRGSHTRFMLEYPEVQGAAIYRLTANFRSVAGVVVLGNAVVQHNRMRDPKAMTLTRGFGGGVYLHQHEPQQAAFMRELRSALTRYQPGEIVILVRRYGQTAQFEAALRQADIAYQVLGAAQFFERPEIRTLVQYARLAMFIAQVDAGVKVAVDGYDRARRAWMAVYARPSRYLRREDAEAVFQGVQGGQPFTTALMLAAGRLPLLARTLEWLAKRVDDEDGAGVFEGLISRLGYRAYLETSSSLPELGREKLESVDAFLTVAKGRSVEALLPMVDQAEATAPRFERNADGRPNVITFMTLFRAKGQEWPVVMLPDVDSDTYHGSSLEDPAKGQDVTEEERRLLYVGITRAQEELHLFCDPIDEEPQLAIKPGPHQLNLSPFLVQAKAVSLLQTLRDLQETLRVPSETWTAAQTLQLALNAGPLALTPFFLEYWEGNASALCARVQGLAVQMDRIRPSVAAEHGLNAETLLPFAYFGPEASDAPFTDLLTLLDPPVLERPYVGGERIEHPKFGGGVVQGVRQTARGLQLSVVFDSGTEARFLASTAPISRVSMLN
ncbi:ATP-dependent helicase [Deinococcus altitudinis]|uniref:ATP-dependent helicase n=1 Tax=Deinococcus altitudinis TaxID=468914 RepID=UPI003892614C